MPTPLPPEHDVERRSAIVLFAVVMLYLGWPLLHPYSHAPTDPFALRIGVSAAGGGLLALSFHPRGVRAAAVLSYAAGWVFGLHVVGLASWNGMDAYLFASLLMAIMPILATLTFRQIAWQRASERAVSRSRAFLHAIIDAIPDPIFVHDDQCRLALLNQAAAAEVHLTPSEAVGKTVYELFPEKIAAQATALLEKALATGEPVTLEPGGLGIRQGLATKLAPLVDPGGHRFVVGVSRDVSEHRRLEKALRASEAKYRQIVDTAREGIVVTDAKAQITFANEAFERMFGYEPGEMLGHAMFEFMDEDQRETARQSMARHGEGQAVQHDGRFRRKDGSEMWCQIDAVRVVDGAGAYAGLRATMTDITAKRRAQAALLAAKETAEAALNAKSEFLARMSHEIRTPMNGVIGMTKLALDTELTGEQREYLEAVSSSAEALLSIIDDILDLSKMDARKFTLETVPFALRDALGEALRALAPRAQAKGLELALDAPEDVPERVVGDPGRLRQVILNLVGNAIKFTEQGEIVVAVGLVERTANDALLDVSVTDTGIGIPKEKMDAIFAAFTQADESTTRRFGGTGLGLTISQQLVALMGGRLSVESKVGRGSTFRFTVRLPLATDDTNTRAVLQNLDGLHVLVVDDNATNRRILVEVAKSWRMVPVAVAGGDAAVAAARVARTSGAPFDLVLLDHVSSEEDGRTIARRLRADGPIADAPFVLVSALGAAPASDDDAVLGIRARLSKPVIASRLLEVIQAVLPRAPSRAPRGKVAPAVAAAAARRAIRPLRVLVADDNPINQRVVVALLERAGHSVVAVENGRLALEAFERGRFDLVLMDMQMPEMDGFEATRAIRTRESAREGTAGKRTPIIALTAQAMKGDRERCLAAGADDYISKPIRANLLFEAIARHAPSHEPSSEAVDLDAMLENLGGDVGLQSELVTMFLADVPALVGVVREQLGKEDAAGLERAAHKLKGSLANLNADAARGVAATLEAMGHEHNLADARGALSTLEHELGRVESELVAWRATRAAPAPAPHA